MTVHTYVVQLESAHVQSKHIEKSDSVIKSLSCSLNLYPIQSDQEFSVVNWYMCIQDNNSDTYIHTDRL